MVFLAALATGRTAQAHSGGVDSTLFGARADGCNECHGGGIAPNVMLTANDVSLTSGQQITLTFTVPTVNGNPGAAGFNIRSSQKGVFAVGGNASAMTQVVTGTNGWSEATHSAPKAGEPATFTTLWTPSAGTSGDVTFTAWGNAVNLANGNQGDHASSAMLVVNVVCPQSIFYRDNDGDGFGGPNSTVLACAAPVGFVASNTDCNDNNPAVHPGATEVCNGVDDNCAGGIDENGVCGDAGADALGAGDAGGANDAADAVTVPDTGAADSGSDGSGADGSTGGNGGSSGDSRGEVGADAADGRVVPVDAVGTADTGGHDVAGPDGQVTGDTAGMDARADVATGLDATVADNRSTGAGADAGADAVAADTGAVVGYTGPVPIGHGGGCACRYGASDSSPGAGLAGILLGLILAARRRRGRRGAAAAATACSGAPGFADGMPAREGGVGGVAP